MIEIPEENITKEYELTFLIPTSYTKSELEDIQDGIEELVEKQDGEVKNKKEWGKRDLAYTIKKEGKAFNEAHYYHWTLKFDPESVNPFKQALKLKDPVIRYLVVVKE